MADHEGPGRTVAEFDERAADAEVLGGWIEWRERCALALCGFAVRALLTSFSSRLFHRFLRRYAKVLGPGDEVSRVAEGECWHLFETYLAARNNRAGKRYKDWLFARCPGDPDVEAVESGAVLLMRNVVREYLRREHNTAATISLHAQLEEGLTVEDLLPADCGPAEEAAEKELRRLAAEEADRFVPEMDRREKVVVFAKKLDLSLAHPEVEQAAGGRKSVLNETYRKTFERLLHGLKGKYAGEDPESLRVLSLMAMEQVISSVEDWGRAEAECACLLKLAEEP